MGTEERGDPLFLDVIYKELNDLAQKIGVFVGYPR
jgi:hypothetical protein